MSLLWEKLIRPWMFRLDAERAHEIGLKALGNSLAFPFYGEPERIELERFGLKFTNPLGVAAGFDKNGVVVDQLAALGFGFVEVGTVTCRPQPGNPKPRLFRLPDDKALINRLGFNNDGAEVIADRLRNINRTCIVGVNIGRNKDVPNEAAVENYLACYDAVHPVADYIAVNISSPNTPGLRALQQADHLDSLLGALRDRDQILGRKPLLVKIAPDLSEGEIEAAVDVCLRHRVDGIIATNTTVSREGLKPDNSRFGDGGLSGRPLAERSNAVLSLIYRFSKGKIPLIGVGGIFTGEDAFEKIAAGASLVQAYTGFVYRGPTFPRSVIRELRETLVKQGFSSIDEAVGCRVGF